MTKPEIPGFLAKAKLGANRKTYRGRFTCPGVQWTGVDSEAMATFTITAEEITDAAEAGLIWTDQDVQRGIVPNKEPPPPREICLRDGYPPKGQYVFNTANADEMAEKLLAGEKLFFNPLIWNLRPGSFEAYWDAGDSSIYLYSGRIYLPDSHHRHQAIVKAVQTWRDAPREYPKFRGDKQYKVELYFFTKDDEGDYFFDKNNRAAPTAKSKGYDLTTMDDLSLLAKQVIQNSSALAGNVNRVTDRLTATNPQVVTLSTLREMMKSFAPEQALDASELAGAALVASSFYDKLVAVRPELGKLDLAERRKIRETLIVDAAVMMHGYAALMRAYNEELARKGPVHANREWDRRIQYLARDAKYHYGKWSGDFFSKENPLWQAVGIVKPGRSGGKLTVINTGGARAEAGRVLRQLLTLGSRPDDLEFLSAR